MGFALGAAHSFDSRLSLEQSGFPALDTDAVWEARSLESPLYYSLRVSRDQGGRAWALRFIHHKVYLANPPAEVGHFAVSHGLNLLTLERSFALSGFRPWLGAGIVVAHPESQVRGRAGTDAYVLTGPTGSAALGRSLRLGARLSLEPEGRVTVSRVRVPVASGEAAFTDVAVHVLLGLDLGL